MANVLPPQEKKNRERDVDARFITVGAGVVAAGALIAMLALLPAFISIHIARSALAPEENRAAASKDDQTKASRAQAMTAALSPLVAATSSPTSALSAALFLRPSGISITSIAYTKGEPSKIILTGTSKSREAINRFRDVLEKDSHFTGIAIPVSALVGTQEGKFTATLTGSF